MTTRNRTCHYKDQQYRDRDNRGLPVRGIREGGYLPSLQLDDTQEPIPEMSHAGPRLAFLTKLLPNHEN